MPRRAIASVLLSLIFTPSVGAAVVAWWPMDDNETGAIVADRARGHHGVFYDGSAPGATSVHHSTDGAIEPGSLCFDGLDDFVQIEPFKYTNEPGEFSLTFWFKVKSIPNTPTNQSFPYMFGHGMTNRSNNLCVYFRSTEFDLRTHTRLMNPGNREDLRGTGGPLWSFDIPAAGLVDGRWHMYALVSSAVDGGTIYIDGVLMGTNPSYRGDLVNLSDPIVLGRRSFEATRFFGAPDPQDGLLDDVALWDEALRPTDIHDIFNHGISAIDRSKAWNPQPGDGAGNVPPDTILSWSAPDNASAYDLYMAADYDSVASASRGDAAFKGMLDICLFDPGRLLPDTTYYWAVDIFDVNGTLIAAGDVWSFTTTVPTPSAASYPSPPNGSVGVSTVTALRWQAPPDAESHDVRLGTNSPGSPQGSQMATVFYPGDLKPNTTYYWRIDEKNPGGTTEGLVWRFTTGPALPEQAAHPEPCHAAANVPVTAGLAWSPGAGAVSHDVYFGTQDPPPLAVTSQSGTFDPGRLQYATTYYWRVNERNAGGAKTGAVWSFATAPSARAVTALNPPDGAVVADLSPTLRWTPVEGVTSYDIYFGDDPNAVAQADPFTHTGVLTTRQASSSLHICEFEPSGLEPDRRYYWRVDPVDSTDANSPFSGTVWMFTTVTACTQTTGPTRALGLYKPGTPVALHEGFVDPPAISRVQGWWQCHASPFTDHEITRELEEFKDKGMGGITIKDTWAMPRDSYTAHIKDIPFMSDLWLDRFAHTVAECGRLGLICRSRFGSGWNAGGPWVTSEMSSQDIAFAQSATVVGPTTYNGAIPTSGNRPTLEALVTGEAFVLGLCLVDRRVLDLTSAVDAQRRLTWQVPDGQWVLISTFSKASGKRLMSTSPTGGGLHHDHLSEAGTDLHLGMLAGRMLDRLGGFADAAFDGFNTDSWEMGNPTWTPGFRQAFIRLRGYDPVPLLPVMTGLVLDPATDERFIRDYRTTVSDLIVSTHYERVSRWCREYGVCLEAEAAGGPSHTVPKDLLKAVGAADIPMGELWMQGRSYVKIPSSAAHAYGKRLVSLEWITQPDSYFAPSPRYIKRRSDEAFLLGGNYLCSSCVNYSPPEAGLPGWVHAPTPRIDHTDTWWPLARPFFDYMGRCCFMLQQGRNIAHVAVYRNFQTGNDKLWYANADDNLNSFPKEYTFDYVNDAIVQDLMTAYGGRIVLPSGACYQVLYVYPLPDGTMPLATLDKIRQLALAGVRIVWVGRPPQHCPGLTDYPACDQDLAEITDDLWTSGCLICLGSHSYAALTPVLERCPEPPAWAFQNNAPLRLVHRRTGQEDLFFIVNRDEEAVDTTILFRIQDRVPALWMPQTGQVRAAQYTVGDDGASVDIHLDAYGSVFVVFGPHGEESQPLEPCTDEPAAMTIDGPWQVRFGTDSHAVTTTFDSLISWTASTNPGIKYYNGVAQYSKTFNYTWPLDPGARITLDLGEVREVDDVGFLSLICIGP